MTGLHLRTKFLLLLTLISLVPLVITTSLNYIRFQKTLEQSSLNLESQLAATAAQKIKSFILSQVDILDTVATLHNPQFSINDKQRGQIVENILYKSDNFTDIDIVNKSGQEILRVDRLVVFEPSDLQNLSQSPAFSTVKDRGLYIGPAYLKAGRVFFDLGRPILDSQGNFSGAVFGQVDAKVMQQVTDKLSAIAGGGVVYMVDQTGVVVAHPNISYVLGQKNLTSLPTVNDVVHNKSETSSSYYNEQGQYVLGSSYPIILDSLDARLSQEFKINWYVIVEQQREIIFAEADRTALFAIFIFLFVIILAVAAAIFFARRISAPVESLYTATQEFGQGNLRYQTEINSNDEIGDLGRNFNKMAKTIDLSIKSIKNEEKIVSAERDKLSLILSGITNAVVAVDLKRNIILFNKAAENLTGLTTAEVTGKGLQKVIKLFEDEKPLKPEEYSPLGKNLKARGGVAYSKNNLTLKNKSGQDRIVNLITGAISEGERIGLGLILTFQDVTREYQIEKTKNEFVSIAAHQLRTPLTGVSWSLQELGTSLPGTLKPKQKELVGQASRGTRRMISLVNDLLNASRIEEGRFSVSLKKQPFAPIIQSVKEAVEDTAAKKNISLKFELPTEEVLLNVDREKMEIILNNIIDNAIKYSSRDSEVALTASVSGPELLITIKDSGIGIPPEDTDRVFSKFFRSEKAILYHTDGSGLGLYVAKNIVDKLGGKIWFESKENQGTSFFISLPLVK